MIRPGALLMGVVMGVVSTGTYYGLELLPPGLIPPPLGRAVAHQAPEAPAHPEPAPVVVAAAAPAPAPTTTESPPPAPAPAAAEAPPAASVTAPAAEQPAAVASVEAAPEAAPQPESPAAPQPASAEPQEAEAVAKTESPAPVAKPAPEADVIKPWWPDPTTMPTNQLKLQYAGQVQGQPAIALLFSAAPKIDTLQQHASILASNGQPVAGEWVPGKNPKLVVFSGLAPGRYTVILQSQVADQQGYMLGATLQGPVYIKAP